MEKKELLKILRGVKSGKVGIEKAAAGIAHKGYEDIVFAKVDHHRVRRQGFCEVIYCEGKSAPQVAAIAKKLLGRSDTLLATRADAAAYKAVKRVFKGARYHTQCRAITVELKPRPKKGRLLVITAGTSDIPVAEEAAVTADIMGLDVTTVYDVGVAGIHRLLDQRGKLEAADCIIVAAGMDGALASVVGGMVAAPVIAVPTSIGYGAAFGGLAALLAMLNSCSAGVAVVNIDNGFGAAALAKKIISLKQGGA